MKERFSSKKAKITTQNQPTGRNPKLSTSAQEVSATPKGAVGSGCPQTSSSPAARTPYKTSIQETSPRRASNPRFPFYGQAFSHALGGVLVLLLMATGLGPYMSDGAKERECHAILGKTLKSANITNARSSWSDIVQTHPKEMKNLHKNVRNSLHNPDRVLIYFKFDLQLYNICYIILSVFKQVDRGLFCNTASDLFTNITRSPRVTSRPRSSGLVIKR